MIIIMIHTQEQTHIERIRKKAVMRCETCFKCVKAIYEVALNYVDNVDFTPQLDILLEDVNDILETYTSENKSLMECLINLDSESEYSDGQLVEMRELVSFSKPITRRFHEYPRTKISGHGGSRTSVCDYEIVDDLLVVKMNERSNYDNLAVQNINNGGHNVEIPSPSNNLDPNSNVSVKPVRVPEIPLLTFRDNIFQWLYFRR